MRIDEMRRGYYDGLRQVSLIIEDVLADAGVPSNDQEIELWVSDINRTSEEVTETAYGQDEIDVEYFNDNIPILGFASGREYLEIKELTFDPDTDTLHVSTVDGSDEVKITDFRAAFAGARKTNGNLYLGSCMVVPEDSIYMDDNGDMEEVTVYVN